MREICKFFNIQQTVNPEEHCTVTNWIRLCEAEAAGQELGASRSIYHPTCFQLNMLAASIKAHGVRRGRRRKRYIEVGNRGDESETGIFTVDAKQLSLNLVPVQLIAGDVRKISDITLAD